MPGLPQPWPKHTEPVSGGKYHVRGKLFVNSTYSRTSMTLGSFDTLPEAVAFLASEFTELVEREELSIDR